MPANVPLTKFEDLPCCPQLDTQPICDVLDFRRRLVFPTPVRGPQEQPIKVEVGAGDVHKGNRGRHIVGYFDVRPETTELVFEEWLRAGNGPTQLAQNCSGKHASMTAVCVINGWPVEGYLNPEHPLQVLVRDTITELTGEDAAAVSTDGCGTPLFAHTLHGMARAYGRIAAADQSTDEGKVAQAMRRFPEMVAGEGRDVTALMRAVPGLLAKDGFEGLQLVGLPDGRGVAVKISDGGDRARMPVTVEVLRQLGVDGGSLDTLQSPPVLGGGLPVGELRAAQFFSKN